MKTKTVPVITFCAGVLCGMGALALTGNSSPSALLSQDVVGASIAPHNLMASLTAGDQHAQDHVYNNIRYGFTLNYPQTLHPQGESFNGDGQTFTSADGKVRVQVYGANLLNEEQLDELYQRAAKDDLYGNHSRLVTDKELGENWFRVSGYTEGDKVFYSKSILAGETLVTFTISYPEEQESQWQSAVSMLDNSFALNEVDF
ncbi:MAG: hypothetical protein CMI08_12420 [Oceanospirillaceae bacterium]|uniref:hypothetical protein n=1 Tax=unclassified Thalassolituus TaxID=2624967 RepID=UPI000C55985F|nr:MULTISPECIES: hypothetical protein [unclassified Thalassolituus]MAS24241.1 hypothetical protein [Oceanospirillaceae bacterium]MAX99980.1 hypothetical protein [Oceanospirillaceae bacterium]MBL36167.1 hypothetical protein [Oceanospirillaceae bacterium]MBS53061.1 hypothetical protein [Oceanospirillaceae bacterium]|tara:strand:+ start:277 stop:882 length:606 start_codon:yes stop_codon:yes gene_type:complete